MRWEDGRRSSNVDDRRGQSARGGLPGGIKLGGGLTIVVVVLGLIFGVDLTSLLQFAGGGGSAPGSSERSPDEDRLADFSSVVLADTEATWNEQFQRMGKRYEEPTLVLFTDGVDSACGFNTSAVGPFYCPADKQVYLDLGFFRDLHERFEAPGDFAQAYVIAHEVGHHVQNLLGTSPRIRRQRQGASKTEANKLTVKLELQADCYAGVWAHHAKTQRDLLDAGDIEEALAAATAIGDDTLQKNAGRAVNPESWTHGSSAQRVRWFKTGFETGDVASCDTFATGSL